MEELDDTICAIATAIGGAIGVIRVSGPEAVTNVGKVFSVPLEGKKSHTLTYGNILDKKGNVIDEVLVSLFLAPHSYTGENSVEISCHGSRYILQKVLERLGEVGCRQAGPGEFTKRAFLHGKMDLSQAEAVADLISSRTASSHRTALNQLRGGISNQLSLLRDKLVKITSLLELELDFSEEDVTFANKDELYTLTKEINDEISRLLHSFQLGNALKNGIPVAIVGETNAGKSTLLNALLHEEKAIVSDIHGTTRDTIEDTVNINGVEFRFIDTAGIRHSEDKIEQLGIQKTFQKLNQADIVLWVVDSTASDEHWAQIKKELSAHCNGKRVFLLLNKCDLPESRLTSVNVDLSGLQVEQVLSISAKAGKGMDKLQELLVSIADIPDLSESDVIITNARHATALLKAQESLHRVQEGLDTGLSGDLIAEDLRQCLEYLGEITGQSITNEEVLGSIFKHFCIGK